MSSTPTTNLSYNKPAVGDRGWGTTMNANLDAIDADLGTEHTSGGGHGPKVTVTQTGDDNALVVNSTNTSATNNAVVVSNSGTGRAISITNDGEGEAVFIDQNATGAHRGLRIDNDSSGDAFEINQNGNGIVVDINKTNTGTATFADLTNGGTGIGLRLQSTNTDSSAICLQVVNSSTGAALDVDVGPASEGVRIEGATGNNKTLVVNATNLGGPMVELNNNADFASTCLQINQTSTDGSADIVQIFHGGTGKYIDTDAGSGTPAQLTNGGVWTDASCFKAFKEDIEPVDIIATLEKVEQMEISRYYDKADKSPERRWRFAPFQDDLVNLFGLSDKGVSAVEVASIALAAIKALKQEVDELRAKLGE